MKEITIIRGKIILEIKKYLFNGMSIFCFTLNIILELNLQICFIDQPERLDNGLL